MCLIDSAKGQPLVCAICLGALLLSKTTVPQWEFICERRNSRPNRVRTDLGWSMSYIFACRNKSLSSLYCPEICNFDVINSKHSGPRDLCTKALP